MFSVLSGNVCQRPSRLSPSVLEYIRCSYSILCFGGVTAVYRWLVRRLVGLQFRQRAYHRSHFALWSIAFVSTATDEIEALAKTDHPFRGDAGDAGGIQPHCSGRALSQ